MGVDKGLQRVAFKEGRSSLAFESSGFIIAAPSTLAERRLIKRAEWFLMMYADMTEDVRREMAMVSPDSSSHRLSIIEDVAEDYGRSPRSVETAIATTRATLTSSATK